MTVEEKIKIIESTESFAEVPREILPPSHKESYYFVSYSHKDYKTVLADILRLEELGVNIWYDNEMHIGENWQEIAQLYISKFQCAGVIFYLTENSITSPACNMEVEYVLNHNKNFISINKPLTDCGAESGYSMLKRLAKAGFPASDELFTSFERAFGDNVLYLSADAPIDRKAGEILAIPREDLLSVSSYYSSRASGKVGSVDACRDNTIISVDLSRLYTAEDGEDGDDSEFRIARIDDCVFTNAIKLSEVILPSELEEIGESAFRNCISLSEIDLSQTRDVKIGENAFRGCSSLSNIDLSRVREIQDGAFIGCSSLTSVTTGGRLGNQAFSSTNIKEVNYTGGWSDTGYMTFYGCKSLISFKTEQEWSKLGDSIFNGCDSLCEVSPLRAVRIVKGSNMSPAKLGASAFGYCKSLGRIEFVGDWDFSEAAYTFSGCDSLREIDLRDGELTDLKLCYGFAKGCESLERISAFEKFSAIGDEAFTDCAALSALDLTAVRDIGKQAFAYSGLERAYLPKAERISDHAFAYCKDLKQVSIGTDCREIGSSAFLGCEALRSVKILSEDIELPRFDSVFEDCTEIAVFYLKCRELFECIDEEGILEGLSVLYIGEELSDIAEELSDFTVEESEESGFIKLVRIGSKPIAEIDGKEIDLAESELNEPIADGERFLPELSFSECFGREVLIKHRRLERAFAYFVEEVGVNREDARIDFLTVSVHTGQSFRLDGTLIEGISTLPGRVAGDYFKIPQCYDLEGRECCISGNGELHYCTVSRVNFIESDEIPTPVMVNGEFVFEDEAESIYYSEDGELRAISGIDIESVTLFDDGFNVEAVIERNE